MAMDSAMAIILESVQLTLAMPMEATATVDPVVMHMEDMVTTTERDQLILIQQL